MATHRKSTGPGRANSTEEALDPGPRHPRGRQEDRRRLRGGPGHRGAEPGDGWVSAAWGSGGFGGGGALMGRVSLF